MHPAGCFYVLLGSPDVLHCAGHSCIYSVLQMKTPSPIDKLPLYLAFIKGPCCKSSEGCRQRPDRTVNVRNVNQARRNCRLRVQQTDNKQSNGRTSVKERETTTKEGKNSSKKAGKSPAHRYNQQTPSLGSQNTQAGCLWPGNKLTVGVCMF